MTRMEKLRLALKKHSYLYLHVVYRRRILAAYGHYRQLKRKYGEDATILLCPYEGTGDVYLSSMYISNFTHKNNINNYVVAVIGGANKQIAALFSLPNVEKLSQEEACNLLRLYLFTGQGGSDIVMLHHHAPQMYTGILENMRNYNNLHFSDMYLANVFQLDPGRDRRLPVFDYESSEIDELFAANNLEPGNTVILSPYVNTLPPLPWWVWVNLAERLTQRGYRVATNCGTPQERPVDGTVPLRFGFSVSVPVLERAGAFVGIRSGFCDVISSARCKKVIIYQPYLFWGCGTNFDYFSLNRIGFCDDAIEMDYTGVEFLDLIDCIMENF